MFEKLKSYTNRNRQIQKQKEKQNHSGNLKKIIGIALLQGLLLFIAPSVVEAVAAPTILVPEIKEIGSAKPIIAGVAPNNTIIELFIDDTLVGYTQTNYDSSGAGNFSWKVQQPLSPGNHSISVRATDLQTQEESIQSQIKIVTVVPFGTPTVRMPDKLVLSKPFSFVAGVAHNNSTVHIFIDSTLTDSITLGEDPSGSIGFKYTLRAPLTSGTHSLYVEAQDKEGKRSLPSKVKIITIAEFPSPTIVTPATNTTILEGMPTIAGLAFNNSKINVFVDGTLQETISIINYPSGIGSFSYTTKKPLDRGKYHRIYTQAVAPDGRTSKLSNVVSLFVDHFFVTPTLLAIKGNAAQPIVSGLAKNDSTIKIYVNGMLDTTITPQNDPSGTLYFEAQVGKKFVPGTYKITAQAYDVNQKPSNISRAKYHTYAIEPKTETPIAAAEQKPAQESKEIVTEEPKKQAEQVNTEDEGEGKTKLEEGEATTVAEGGEKAVTETQTADTEKQEETDKPSTGQNLPLVLGLIILIGLAILFIVWYLGQKRRLLNEGIDKLFSEPEDVDFKKETQETLFDTGLEEPIIDTDTIKKETKTESAAKKDDISDGIPPPPPPI